MVDRIGIAHQHDRRGLVGLAEGGGLFQRPLQCHPRFQRAQRRGLDRRAVGHRIGKGHAQLDHIGTGGGKGIQKGLAVAIPGHHVGDETGTVIGGQLRETGGEAIGHD